MECRAAHGEPLRSRQWRAVVDRSAIVLDMDDASSHDLLLFTSRVLALLDGGRRVATYKLAVLLALMDCCSRGLAGNDVVPLRDVAARVIELYWPMVRPSPLSDRVLRQSEQPKSLVLSEIAAFRIEGERAGTGNLLQAMSRLPAFYERCLDHVGQVLASQPLPKLQRPQVSPATFMGPV
jgi:hypothetical protein